MKNFKFLVILLTLGLISFTFGIKENFDFSYPKRKGTTISLIGQNFSDFNKEWRGSDYFYLGMNKDSIICSILFYKLNKNEQKLMVEPFGITTAGIPFIYFSKNSNLKKYEKNNFSWGEMTDDFMFRQNDVLDLEGMKLKQKHMYAYAMFDKDIFVNVHLSKNNYTLSDSLAMREMLNSLKKQK